MKKLNVTIICKACYNGIIEVPDGMTLEEAIEFARQNLDSVPLGELEYIPCSDELDEENCDFEDDDDEPDNQFVVRFDEDGQNMDEFFVNKDDAIAYAKRNIEDGPVLYEIIDGFETPIQYFYNEDEDDDEEDNLTPEQKNIVNLWDVFDNVMSSSGYSTTVIDADTLDEERSLFGKPSSCMGTIATKEDRYCPFFRLYIFNTFDSFTIRVYDRNGNAILSGRELVSYKVTSDMTVEQVRDVICELIHRFAPYDKENPVPREGY